MKHRGDEKFCSAYVTELRGMMEYRGEALDSKDSFKKKKKKS